MANNILSDYQKMKEERERRDSTYEVPELLEQPKDEYDPMADVDDMLKQLRLSKKLGQANKMIEEANADEYNPMNLTPEDRDAIEATKIDHKETDKELKNNPYKGVEDMLAGKDVLAKEPNMSVGEPASIESSAMEVKTPEMETPVATQETTVETPDMPARTIASTTPVVSPTSNIPSVKTKPDASVDELDKARRNRDILDMLSSATAGISKAGAAYAGGGLTQLKADTSMADKIALLGKNKLADAKEDKETRAAKKKAEAEMARQDRLDRLNTIYKTTQINKIMKEFKGSPEMDDPKSEVSRKMQDIEMAALRSQGAVFDEDEMRKLPANYLKNTSYIAGKRKQQTKQTIKREGRLERQFGYKKKEQFEKDARTALKDMRETESWKNAEKSLSTIPEIRLLLDDAYKEGGQSLAMLGPRVAKGIAGEVGVLTEQDVTRYVKNPTIAGGMVDDLKKATKGQISKASYENLKRLLEVSEKVAQEKMDKAMDRESTLLSRREKIGYDEARHFIDSEFTNKVERKELSGQDKQAYDWAKANKDDPRAKAILAKLGME